MQAPGGFEAGLDGRHIACRPIPVHYTALRNALMQVAALSQGECPGMSKPSLLLKPSDP